MRTSEDRFEAGVLDAVKAKLRPNAAPPDLLQPIAEGIRKADERA